MYGLLKLFISIINGDRYTSRHGDHDYSHYKTGGRMGYQKNWVNVGMMALLLCVLGGVGGAVSSVFADESVVDLNSPEAIRHTLEQQTGKRVKLKLQSGQELEGKISKVGSNVVVVSELSGMEFFDATVRVDQVAAVIVRVRTK
jgi:hypothetical protein